MFGIGIQELGLILVVALLVFGPKRLPELARTLGRGLGEFRKASNDLRQSFAFDDLQRDLRKGLSSTGEIHKPGEPTDRPAQAGDDLAAGEALAAHAHPGELPLGNDHEHRPEAQVAAESAARDEPTKRAKETSEDSTEGGTTDNTTDNTTDITPDTADPRRD